MKNRRSSAEIVAASTELRHRQAARKKGKGGKDGKVDDNKRELEMDEHKKSIPELCADMTTSVTLGMSTADADARREIDGLNKLTPPKQTPEIVKLFRELTGFFSLLLLAGGILCEVCYALQGSTDNLYLGIVLFCVVIITGVFSYSQNRKSSNLMESFKNMMPTITTVIRDGKSQKIDASLLVRGDVIQIKGGDKVPADIRIIECSDDLAVDNSCLTGEPEPLKRVVDCTHDNPLETKNLCFFGTFIPQGSGKGLIVRTGDRTVMGRIAKLATSTAKEQTPIAKEIDHFVHIITAVAVATGLVFLIIGFGMGTDAITNIVFMIGIIVANVPEGLLATVAVCLSLAAARMAKKSVLVKNLEGVETLGSTSCICSDKTGTLTQNIMTVANVVYDNIIYDAECSITPTGNYKLTDSSFQRLQRCATLCNNAVFDEESKYQKVVEGIGKDVHVTRGAPIAFSEIVVASDGSRCPKVLWETIGDASESAMIKFCQDKRDIIEYRGENSKIKEIPFNSRNKYQLSIHKQENDETKPMLLVMKGAPERIIARCSTIMINGQVEELNKERLDEIEARQLALSKKGMRVLGFAEKELDLATYPHGYDFNTDNCNFPLGEKNVDYDSTPKPDKKIEEPLCFIGLMALIDPPRPEVPIAVAKCKTAGIRVIMVTGDHPITAKAIAHKVGILWGPTKEDIEDENKERGLNPGDPGYRNPESAPAIVVPGWTISIDTPEEEWDRILDHAQCVFARTSPQQKLIIVENCQRRGEIVAVTGDGVNDSPALKKADIGIAMGIMGSEVSKEAADMILLDDNFASIVCGVEEGRKVFDNLKKSICYALAVNIPELVPFLVYILIALPVPLTTVLMLLICLGTDMIPAISMAYEDSENDIMLRAPRRPSIDRLVTKKLVFWAYIHIGFVQAFAGHVVYFTVMNDYGYPAELLPGLGQVDRFGKQVLWCKTTGGQYCTPGGSYTLNGQLNDLGSVPESVCSPTYNPTIPASGNIYDAQIFYDPGHDGTVTDCIYPYSNFRGSDQKPVGFDRFNPTTYQGFSNKNDQVTVQSMQAVFDAGYRPYYPFKARRSSFFNKNWINWNPTQSGVDGFGTSDEETIIFLYQSIGVWSITDPTKVVDKGTVATSTRPRRVQNDRQTTLTNDALNLDPTSSLTLSDSNLYSAASSGYGIKSNNLPTCNSMNDCLLDYRSGFTYFDGTTVYTNVMSRMMQACTLAHAQTAYFVGVVVMQWSNVLICKTRFLSIRSQGLRNSVLMFGLGFEFLICALVCYSSGFQTVFKTQTIRLTHWFPAMPFAMFLFVYDEMRKYILRSTSIVSVDPETGKSNLYIFFYYMSVVYDISTWRLTETRCIYRRGRIRFSNGDVYDGEWVDGKREGHGIFYYENGSKYTGEMKSNLYHGYGILIISDCLNPLTMEWKKGSTYEGYFQYGKKNGQGIIVYGHGGSYEGEFLMNQYDGNGVRYYSNGDRYDGNWKCNLWSGYGELKRINGEKYTGEFKYGLFHNFGFHIFSNNGGRYEGDYLNGKQHGNGLRIFSDGTKYDGEWKDNKMNGNGVYTTNTFIYIGTIKEGYFYGHGKYTYKDGSYYDGEYIASMPLPRRGKNVTIPQPNGKKHGNGFRQWSNGNSYQGNWMNDRMHGKGLHKSTLTTDNYSLRMEYEGEFSCGYQTGHGTLRVWNPNGLRIEFPFGKGHWFGGKGICMYVGNFLRGNFDGKGVLTTCDGRRYEGEWKDSNLHGHGIVDLVPLSERGDDSRMCIKGCNALYRMTRYEGNHVDGKRNGYGTAYYSNQDAIQGQFKNGHVDGMAVYIYASGKRRRGVWTMGKRISWLQDEEVKWKTIEGVFQK